MNRMEENSSKGKENEKEESCIEEEKEEEWTV